MARIKDVIVDCSHPATVARFWAATLDDHRVAAYDDAELERLRSMGINDPEDDPTVLVEAPQGQPRMFFQRVPEAKTGKNRLHLDLIADDRAAEIARLIGLGAREQTSYGDHTVLTDPESNEFCVFDH